jgi:hypothetical protein
LKGWNYWGRKKRNETMLIVCRNLVIKVRNQGKHNMSKRNLKMSKTYKFKIDLIMFVCNEWFDVLFEIKMKEVWEVQ